MEVLILSKTHYGDEQVCVGGIVPETNQYVRLLKPGGYYQDIDTEFEIGEIWDIDFQPVRNPRPPHIEDVIVQDSEYLRDVDNMTEFIQSLGVDIWEGSPDNLFDGLLNWTESGSGYINEEGGIPAHSVGFWISDRRLRRHFFTKTDEEGNEKESIRYNYPMQNKWRSLPFKGCTETIEIIPAGTMIRVSLAKWWDTKGTTDERCALQLSGWY